MTPSRRRTARALFEPNENASLLEILDSLLNKGVMANGDVVLGVAGVDLIYLRLSTLLTAVDRLSRPPALANRSPGGKPRRDAEREGGRRAKREGGRKRPR
jgi:hypothetical protein